MNKFDKLKSISNSAAKQASEDCAAKIEKLTKSQLDTLLAELKSSGVNKNEVNELLSKVQVSTNKNKAVRDFMKKSENICQVVAGIIGKMVTVS
ncbi:hypothetical protein LJC57_02265 [Parabacteroides sp. OttesenSCG-928-G07]|nr:hypothetical protein [Parabacteroides sp. OttesenSCG-928-G07]